MRPLSVLLLSDDRPGHYHLAEGVIAAIARVRPVETSRLLVRRRRWLPGRVLAELLLRGLPPRSLLAFGYGLDTRQLPKTDLIVSAGGETLVANAAMARLTGAPNIFCGSLRRLPPEAFALVVSSYARHAGLAPPRRGLEAERHRSGYAGADKGSEEVGASIAAQAGRTADRW